MDSSKPKIEKTSFSAFVFRYLNILSILILPFAILTVKQIRNKHLEYDGVFCGRGGDRWINQLNRKESSSLTFWEKWTKN
jgi:hypothetical protein